MIKYFCVREEDTTGAITRRVRGREMISICGKCMQAFVTDVFLRRAAADDGQRRRDEKKRNA